MMRLVKELGTAIGEYSPLQESREEFARRLTDYFARENSLDYFGQRLSRLDERELVRKLRVFIAATGRGKTVARAVTKQCKALGADTWLAENDLSGGDNLESEIIREIEKADLFLVVISKDFGNSSWIGKEIAVALQRSSGLTPRVVPIVLRGVQLPEALCGLEAIRMEDDKDIKPEVLLKVLRSVG
jgi:hypothetical protein